jgi:hypothetical protein
MVFKESGITPGKLVIRRVEICRRASRCQGYLYKVAWGLWPLIALYEGKVLYYYVVRWQRVHVARVERSTVDKFGSKKLTF